MEIVNIYEKASSILSIGERKKYLSTLTDEEKIEYRKYLGKLRQIKFNSNPENKEKYNNKRKEHITQLRKNEPEKMKAQTNKDIKEYRKREKVMIENIKKKQEMINNFIKNNQNKKIKKIFDSLKKNDATEHIKRKVGRPRKIRNPVGRPRKNPIMQ